VVSAEDLDAPVVVEPMMMCARTAVVTAEEQVVSTVVRILKVLCRVAMGRRNMNFRIVETLQ
jgi:hypothetical protein